MRHEPVWLVLINMQKAQPDQYAPFDIDITDIAKKIKLANPYQKERQEIIIATIETLFDTRIRIRNTQPGKGFSANFPLLTGIVDHEKRTGRVSVSPFLTEINKILPLIGLTSLNIEIYFKIRSDIAKAVYKFLQSQQKFYREGEWYEINVKKLLYYINYDYTGIPFWQVMQNLKKALIELRRKKLIKYRIDTDRMKSEGGILCFDKPKNVTAIQRTNQPTASRPNKITDLIDLINDKLPEDKQLKRSAKLSKTIDDLGEYLKTLDRYNEITLKGFLPGYMEWLNETGCIKFISYSLFEVNNGFLQRYIEQEKERGRIETTYNELEEMLKHNNHEEPRILPKGVESVDELY
jgi:hypothetical protein